MKTPSVRGLNASITDKKFVHVVISFCITVFDTACSVGLLSIGFSSIVFYSNKSLWSVSELRKYPNDKLIIM